jgi:hypothetical protein
MTSQKEQEMGVTKRNKPKKLKLEQVKHQLSVFFFLRKKKATCNQSL